MAEPGRGRALDEAARVWGLQPRYQTDEGKSVQAPDEAVLAALRELGAPVEGPSDLAAAVRVGEVERWTRPIEPAVVCWENPDGQDGAAPTVELRLLAGEANSAVQIELTREGGECTEWAVRAEDFEGLATTVVDDREYVSGRIRLPADLPSGYHRLTVRSGPRHADAHLLRAPRRAWTPELGGTEPRDWGVFLPLYALRTGRTPGVADLTDLETLQRWTAERGGAAVGTLPLLASFLDRPFDPSPYAPVSRLFWNELYLDVERVPGLDQAPETRRLLESRAYRAEGERLRAEPEVEHRAAYAHRRAALESLVREVAPADAPLPVELAEYAGARPEAEDYAAFRALGERQPNAWRSWPAHLRAGSVAQRDYDESTYRYHLYAQWAMDRELGRQARGSAGERAPLYMDLPLGSHPDGFDVWRWRDLFADASAGAPPDAFFAGGQDWGFPPVHPRRAREEGHAYWARSLRHLMRVAGMLRLDHVMSMRRLFWIPGGFSATQGVYVRYPAEELYAVLCLESHRHRTEIVGEDLGTVPPVVREDMERHRIRRMYVLPFELDAEKRTLAPEPSGSVASLNTHDLPPFAAYVRSPETAAALARAVGARGVEPEQLLEDTLVRLAEGPARLVLVSLEDLWLELQPQNRPGTAAAENWRRKARHGLAEIDGLEGARRILAAVDAARRGRSSAAAPQPRGGGSRASEASR